MLLGEIDQLKSSYLIPVAKTESYDVAQCKVGVYLS